MHPVYTSIYLVQGKAFKNLFNNLHYATKNIGTEIGFSR